MARISKDRRTPPPDYDPGKHWLEYRRIAAADMRRLVGCWHSDVGYLELRLSGLCPSTDVYRRYQTMCEYWRRVTNGRFRHRRVDYGGFRAVEFCDVLDVAVGGDTMIDVYFCVITRTRWESMQILAEWLSVTQQRYNRLRVYSTDGELVEERVDAWDQPTLWSQLQKLLSDKEHIMVDVGDQRIGGRKSWDALFDSYVSRSFKPMFRYKWLIPFGSFDKKTKVKNNFVPPPPPGYELVQTEKMFERVVKIEMPPTTQDIRNILRDCFPPIDTHRLNVLVDEFMECNMMPEQLVKSIVRIVDFHLADCHNRCFREFRHWTDATDETPAEWLERKRKERLKCKRK